MITTFDINSSQLHMPVNVGLVEPVVDPDRVLFLLHGYNGSFELFCQKLPLQGYADAYRLLIVCPNLPNDFYIDRFDRSYGRFMTQELQMCLAERFPRLTDGKQIIGGVSMGGYGALLLGCHYPGVFSHVISLSGAFIAHDVCIGEIPAVKVQGSDDYFQTVFGPDIAALDESAERNPLAALDRLVGLADVPEIWLSCGVKDPLYSKNLYVVDALRKRGLPHHWIEQPGGHTFEGAEKALRDILEKIREKTERDVRML